MELSSFQIARDYFQLGYTHVIPLGYDHILFILGVFLLNSHLKSVIIQCSVFTLAHSITLGLTATGFLMPDSRIIEPMIAISILFVAIENIFHNKINAWRLLIIFFFGLIHGMGFANAIKDIGLSKTYFLGSLLFFNIGVEFGQITIILSAYLLIAKWFGKKEWYNKRIVYPVSSLIGCIALYWTIERIFFAN
jgi:hydrogenase/urease accessory protein HupE